MANLEQRNDLEVLIIDSHPISSATIRLLLVRKHQIPLEKVVIAPQLKEAEDILFIQRADPKFVILDPEMPDGDGNLLLERMREADSPFRTTRVAVFTAGFNEDMQDYYQNLGVSVYTSKPDIKDLEGVLKDI